MGVTERLLHFSSVCNKGSGVLCVGKEEDGVELEGLFMGTAQAIRATSVFPARRAEILIRFS